jgi:serine/threonine-protein kinase
VATERKTERDRRPILLLVTALCVLLSCARSEVPVLVLARWTVALDGDPTTVTLPAVLEAPPRRMPIVLATRAEVPADGALDLLLPAVYGRASIRADGHLCRELRPGDGSARPSLPVRVQLPREATADGVVDLEITIDHASRASASLPAAPEIVEAGSAAWSEERHRSIGVVAAWFGLVSAASIAMVFLPIFVLDRKRVAYLWISIQALTTAPYCAYLLGLTDGLAPWDAVITQVLLVIAATASVHFTHQFFALGPPSRFWRLSAAVGIVASLLFADPFSMRPGIAVSWTVGTASLWQLVIGARLARTPGDRFGGTLIFSCWAILSFFATPELLLLAGGPDLLGGLRPSGIGIGLFAVGMGILLSERHQRLLAEADDRVEALRARQQENEILNARLREQIAERSAQLFAALAAADGRLVRMPDRGEILDGEYEILRPLGRGGTSRVYEARRLSDGARVAVKITSERRADTLARLAREAQVATSLRHPNLVEVHDVRMSSRGFLYLVLELVDGPTLAEYARGPLSLAEALRCLAQIADGLRALHGVGIVHRDLKPENVLIAAARIKLLDFGISRWIEDHAPTADGQIAAAEAEAEAEAEIDAEPTGLIPNRTPPRASGRAPALTQTGLLAGTPAYVAPELAKEGSVSFASDVFAFGVVAFEILTGVRPWDVPPIYWAIDGRTAPEARSITHLRGDLPPAIAQAIGACLDLDPDRRPSLEALATLLSASNDRASALRATAR